jgi:cell division protein FtsB
MNLAWLLKSRTICFALAASSALTVAVLLFSPKGVPSLNKRKAELFSHKTNLLALAKQNKKLFDDIRRLDSKDPELMEELVRRMGYDRPGEKVYVFGEQLNKR